MPDDLTLRPSAALGVRRNLQRYIDRAKALSFELGANYDDDEWSKSQTSERRASSAHGQNEKLVFVRHPSAGRKQSAIPLNDPFKSFLKAVIRHGENQRPKSIGGHRVLLRAGRYLNDALATEGYDPTLLRPEHFNVAARAAKAREADSSAYRVGTWLAGIARTLRDEHLTVVRFKWKNTIKRPKGQGGSQQLGFTEEAMELQSAKMLTVEQVAALGRVSRMVDHPADRLRARVVEMLVCCGFRIGECLSLPADCLVYEEAIDDFGHAKLDVNGEPVINLGIRYWPEKGGHTETAIKWVPTALKEVAEQAILEIKSITESARENARHLKENEDRAVLPFPYSEMPPDTVVLIKDAEKTVGVGKAALTQATRSGALSSFNGEEDQLSTTIGDLHAFLRRKSKLGPVVRTPVIQEIDDSLFVVPANFLHEARCEYPGTVVPVTDQHISNFLCGRGSMKSVFERLNILGDDGRPFRIRTHQPRHFLHTTLVEGGLPEHLLARHFGRADPSQNECYNHTTPVQRAYSLQQKLVMGKACGAIDRIVRNLEVHDREHFRKAVIATAHITDFGYCILDWSSVPCLEHGRCIGCAQLLIEKGNKEHRKKVAQDVDDASWLLAHAVAAEEDDILGADNHRAHNERIVKFGRAVLGVHDNPEIPDGTLVHVTSKDGEPIWEIAHDD